MSEHIWKKLAFVLLMFVCTADSVEVGNFRDLRPSRRRTKTGSLLRTINPSPSPSSAPLTAEDAVAEIVFQYSVRFSGEVVEEGRLFTCLEEATTRLLLDRLAGCPVDDNTGMERTRKLLSSPVDARILEQALDGLDLPLQHVQPSSELATSLSQDESPPPSCPYEVKATVEQMSDNLCRSSVSDSNVTHCALVRSRVVITTTLVLEPLPTSLRSKAVAVLRDAIDNGDLEKYVPVGCLSSDEVAP